MSKLAITGPPVLDCGVCDRVAAALMGARLELLWDERGAFRGSINDDMPDCEYTYALLTVGCLWPEPRR